jgi:hypothetical protein
VFGAFLTGNQQWIEKYGLCQLLQNQHSAFRIAEKCLDAIRQHVRAAVSRFDRQAAPSKRVSRSAANANDARMSAKTSSGKSRKMSVSLIPDAR